MFISRNQLENSIFQSNYGVSLFYKEISSTEFYQLMLDVASNIYSCNHGF